MVDLFCVKTKEEIKKVNEEIMKTKEGFNGNIDYLKKIKKLFTTQFSSIVDDLSAIPEDFLSKKKVEEEEGSPASIRRVTFWEWDHLEASTKKFEKDGDNYRLTKYGGYGNLYAYSSVSCSEGILKQKLKFSITKEFNSGGFGVISKNHKDFKSGINKTSANESTYPFFCLCCTGNYIGIDSVSKQRKYYLNFKNMQDLLKEADMNNKHFTSEINFDEMQWKCYGPNDVLFSSYDLNFMNQISDLVLIFHTDGGVIYSHEIELI